MLRQASTTHMSQSKLQHFQTTTRRWLRTQSHQNPVASGAPEDLGDLLEALIAQLEPGEVKLPELWEEQQCFRQVLVTFRKVSALRPKELPRKTGGGKKGPRKKEDTDGRWGKYYDMSLAVRDIAAATAQCVTN